MAEEDAYAGRWVARLRGRIVAQGGTPEQARLAALARYKEKPEVVFVAMAEPMIFPTFIQEIVAILPEERALYLVGGAVRDMLLGNQAHDFDFILDGDGIAMARKIANALKADFYPLDPERDTGRVLCQTEDGGRIVLDFATYRGDAGSPEKRASLESDLRGRDFTVNAIAVDLRNNQVHDPLGGGQDLREKKLRMCSAAAMANDPVRILRGIRLVAGLGFGIQPETRQAMKLAVGGLAEVSPERVRDELLRILGGPAPAVCMRVLDMLGVIKVILPELVPLKGTSQPLPHTMEAWEHTLAVLSELEKILGVLGCVPDPEKGGDLLSGLLSMTLGRFREGIATHFEEQVLTERSRRGLLFMAALLHDIAKPLTGTADEQGQLHFLKHEREGAAMAGLMGRRLALSNDESEYLETMVGEHMRLPVLIIEADRDGKYPTRRAIYRFFRASGPAGVDLCLLALADMRATYGQTLPDQTWAKALEVVKNFLENWFEKPTESIQPPDLLNGDVLMSNLGLAPGPKVGELLELIREARASGEIGTPEEAIALARKNLES